MKIKSNPLCLVAVPTFRRAKFLPRLLACFKSLEYDNKKLLIINDDVETTYSLKNPDTSIEIVNLDKHLQLSVKRNLFSSWQFDIMFPLDDDDLFLPTRLANHVYQYQLDPSIDMYRNTSEIRVLDKLIKVRHKSAFTNSSYTREGYFKSGGHIGFFQSNYDDISLHNQFNRKCKIKFESIKPLTDFVYWKCSSIPHNSNNKSVLISEERDIETRKFQTRGDVILEEDYNCYNNIKNISNIALRTEANLNITLSEDSTDITQYG
jgi:glycosyltransferase involved in cell wall biosynthesis